MKLVHKAIIQWGEVLQAIRAGLFEALEKEHLSAGVELFQEMTELSHRIAACRDTENIVNQTFHELLRDIFTCEIAVRQFA